MTRQFQMISPSFSNNFVRTGVEFVLLEKGDREFAVAFEWLEEKMPIASQGRIDWKAISEKSCLSWSSQSELLSNFESLVNENNLMGTVFLLWTNALKKPIKVDLAIVIQYASEIFEEDWDLDM